MNVEALHASLYSTLASGRCGSHPRMQMHDSSVTDHFKADWKESRAPRMILRKRKSLPFCITALRGTSTRLAKALASRTPPRLAFIDVARHANVCRTFGIYLLRFSMVRRGSDCFALSRDTSTSYFRASIRWPRLPHLAMRCSAAKKPPHLAHTSIPSSSHFETFISEPHPTRHKNLLPTAARSFTL